MIPPSYELISHCVLSEGCAIEAKLRHIPTDELFCVTAIYLPPDDRDAVLSTISSHDSGYTRNFYTGDLNFDACDPRTATGGARRPL